MPALGWGSASPNAEPYLAVQTGSPMHGVSCEPYGRRHAQHVRPDLGTDPAPEKRVDTGEPWTGELSRFFAVGGNVRASGSYTDIPNQKSLTSFDIDSARPYLDVRAIPDRLSIYVDQKVAPGGSTNNEAYARLSFANQRYYVKAGQLYLPYGIRLQDDSPFTRQVTGINFATPDRGVEVGFERARHGRRSSPSPTAQRAGRQRQMASSTASRTEYVRPMRRLGASFNLNQSVDGTNNGIPIGKRQMQNIFAGLRTGRSRGLPKPITSSTTR